MKKSKKIIAGLLVLLLTLSLAACRGGDSQISGQEEDVQYTIGVAVFDPDDPELNMFINYYKSYIEEGFPVKFYFSNVLSSAEDENDFIRTMKEKGADGIISFYGLDVQNTVKVCEEEEMYYVLGSGTLSDEDFNAVKDNPWFLGTVGPDPALEYQAGADLADFLTGTEAESCLILTGGSAAGNFMHLSRSKGLLEQLGYEGDVDALLAKEENSTLTIGDLTITLCPGYLSTEDGLAHLASALEAGDYDAALSTYGVSSIMDQLLEKEENQGKDMKIGLIDCFSETNFIATKAKDAYGGPQIDFVEGKYASMAGPAFAVLYNAMSGHPEANSEDGSAVRLYQGFWKAENRESYVELYGYTQGIYANAYSCKDLMQVIKVFDEDASPSKLKALAESYTVEDVKARIMEQ